MNPTTWLFIITTLTTSTVLTITSNHWLLAWVGLELNTLSILPIIMKSGHPRATEAATKYFLTQTTAAALILLSSAINTWQTGQWTITHTLSPSASTILTVAIMMKLALAPTHFWYPEVLQGVTLPITMLLTTWQKLAPLGLLYLTQNHLPQQILLTTGLLSIIVGGMMGLNQTQTRKIIAYSSIAHMGWLMTTLTLTPELTTLTFITYITLTLSLLTSLATTTTKTISDLGTASLSSPLLLTTTLLTLVSLGGLPPLTGFLPKWLILTHLTNTGLLTIATMMAIMSLPSLYFYTRAAYFTVITTAPTCQNTEYKWRFKTSHPTTPQLTTLATMLLPTTPLLLNLL
nr:NADH dehydrogenase subunit 2 [Ptenopus garrulus]